LQRKHRAPTRAISARHFYNEETRMKTTTTPPFRRRLPHTIAGALCIAASAGATAQSSVQLFGTLDMNLTYTKSDGRSVKSMDQGGNIFPSRLGFRGTEDLGGGLAASF
jgi:hypothetical protein